MSSPTPKWLIACGVGCAVLAVLAILLVLGGVWWVRDSVKGFDEAIATRDRLEAQYGDSAAYTPTADGAVPPDRMEAFLAVREAQADVRRRIEAVFEALPLEPAEAEALDRAPAGEKTRSVWKILGAGFGLIGELGEFYEIRNERLLDAGMGLGEYSYIYVLAYHVWLGHPAGEGPGSELDDRIEVDIDTGIEGRLHDELLAMLRNQLAALGDDVEPAWRQALEREIEAMHASRGRLPWADGLPPAIAASFEPYRERLEANYSAMTNEFELGKNRKSGLNIRSE